MSRVGKNPVKFGSNVKVTKQDNVVHVEGPKGKLNFQLPQGIDINVADGEITILKDDSFPKITAMQGTARAQIYNMVHGVTEGFVRELDIIGVGYRAAVKGNTLSLTVGFSHPVDFELPTGITAKVESNTHLVLNGSDKMLIGMVADKIRSIRPPEPYQGKGIKYTNERIVRKAGKAAGAK